MHSYMYTCSVTRLNIRRPRRTALVVHRRLASQYRRSLLLTRIRRVLYIPPADGRARIGSLQIANLARQDVGDVAENVKRETRITLVGRACREYSVFEQKLLLEKLHFHPMKHGRLVTIDQS